MVSKGNRLFGAACMVVSAFFFALVGVVIKMAGQQVGIWETSFYRALTGIVIMLALAWVLKVSLKGAEKKLLLLRGASGAMGFLLMVLAVRNIPLAEVMVLFYLFPVFAAMLAPWLNHERLARRDWLFLALAFVGTGIILNPSGGPHLSLGHFCALGTALTAGLNTSLVRRLSDRHSPYAIYYYFCLVAAVISIFPLVLSHESLVPPGNGMWYLVGIGVAATVGQVFMNMGFFHLPAAEGGVVMMSQLIIAATWGVLFFGEPLSWRLVVGGLLIVVGGAFLNRSSQRRTLVAEMNARH